MKRALTAALAGLLIAACGSTAAHHPVHRQHQAACRTMNCVLRTLPAPQPPKNYTLTRPVASGIDFAWSCPNPAGHGFGASYLSWDASKNWTRSCVDTYQHAGAAVVLVWEAAATDALGGRSQGIADAKQAASQAAALGEPSSRPIYFAVDFDETPTQASTVAAYFQGVASVIGLKRTGAYGGYWVISRLFNAHLITYGWQTYAWSGGLWDARAQLQQYLNGPSVDQDRAVSADYGQWPYKPKPTPKPSHPVCFGKGSHPTWRKCRPIVALYQHREGAAAASLNAAQATEQQIAVLQAQDRMFRQRVRWFTTHAAQLVREYSR